MNEKIMDRMNPIYHLEYNDLNIYDVLLICHSKGVDTKIKINYKIIVQIIFDKKDDKIDLFIFLKNPPKVYTMERNIYLNKMFYYEKFEENLFNYEYDTFYKNVDKNNLNKYYKVKHAKK